MGMGNQPVYRYPPRSHAYNCPCSRCVQCRRDRPSGGWGIIVPFFLAAMFAVWPFAVWHGCKYGGQDLSGCGAGSEWVWSARSWVACGIWWGFLAAGLAAAVAAGGPKRTRKPVVSKRSVAEAVDIAARIEQIAPLCPHLNAFKVDSAYWKKTGRTVIVCCWCPDCEEDLPANFRHSCCGTEPGDGTNPARHVYNCPHRKEPS